MIDPALMHERIAIEATISASPQRVFDAWADPGARSVWGAPSGDEAIEFLATDFRVGGRDVSLCGQRGDLRFRVESEYHDIRAPLRILFTESVSTDGALLCVSLVTAQFFAFGEATRLNLTVQVTSLVGEDMIAGNRGGWESALRNLEAHLA